MVSERSLLITNTNEWKRGKRCVNLRDWSDLMNEIFSGGWNKDGDWGWVENWWKKDKKNSILCLYGVQEVWNAIDLITKMNNISLKVYTCMWMNKKLIDTGFEYISYLRSSFSFSGVPVFGFMEDKTINRHAMLLYD